MKTPYSVSPTNCRLVVRGLREVCACSTPEFAQDIAKALNRPVVEYYDDFSRVWREPDRTELSDALDNDPLTDWRIKPE